MNFYTGIQMFNVIFILIELHLPNIVYLIGPAKHRMTLTKIKKHSVTKNSKKLTKSNEILSTFIRLRLGKLNEDLVDRLCISLALCSQTFTTWIRLMRQLLGHALVVWLPSKAIRQNFPIVFRKARILKLPCNFEFC